MLVGKTFKVMDLDSEIQRMITKVEFDKVLYSTLQKELTAWIEEKNWTPPNETIKEALIKYLVETSPKMRVDGVSMRTKGLFFIGNSGVGKTFASKIISIFRGYKFFKAYELVEMFKENKEQFIEVMKSHEIIIVDDLGAEYTLVHYGHVEEVMSYAINLRSDVFIEFGVLTLFTSNLNKEEFIQRYTKRCYSRIKGMCDVVQAKGKDLRYENEPAKDVTPGGHTK